MLDERLFYTLRKAGDPDRPLYELSKWSEDRVRPLDVYVQWIVQRRDNTFSVHSCNCPSRSNPCKHAAISIALLDKAGIDDLPFYLHDGTTIILALDFG